MRTAPSCIVVLGLLSALACSSESEEKSSAFSGFVDRFASRYCELAGKCCSNLGTESSTAACRSSVSAVIGAEQDSIDEGRASYDADAAEKCLSELDAFMASCAPTTERPEVCSSVVRGKLQPGDACALDTDCAPASQGTAACKVEDGATHGVCVELVAPAAGVACDQTVCDRDPTLYCDFGSGTCVLRPVAGQACSVEVPCADGTSCLATTCVADQPLGGDCSLGARCMQGSYCAGGKCVAQKAAGEPCTGTASNECLSACDGTICEPVEPDNITCFTE
jgi:hypothetical protein